ncbi:MAG: hypothetical protein KTR20_05735 [Cellvibrionaceae bacterium]|nr:hypothetical protein [Cellvibrionaceae bacterium]
MQLSYEIFDFLFLILMIITIAGVIWMPLAWLLLSIFTPKTLLDSYFKEPHFTLTETVMMRSFPGFLVRTGIFAWLTLVPSIDRKRQIKNIEQSMPAWYAIALKTFLIGAMATMFLFFSLMAILLIIKPV